MLQAPWSTILTKTDLYRIWSRTPILMLHQPYLKTIVTEGAHLRNSISSDNVQQIKLIFAI